MPPKTLVKIGAILLAAAVLVCWRVTRWVNTRIFVPVDMPISLDGGQIHTGEFAINLRETYWISVDQEYSRDAYMEELCPWWSAHWKLSRLRGGIEKSREIWAASDEPKEQGTEILGFRASPGTYQLNWEMPAGAKCSNVLHPRLRIATSADDYEQLRGLTQYGRLFLAGIGVMLVLRGVVSWLLGDLAKKRVLRIFPEMALRHVLPLARHRPIPPIGDLSSFGIVWGSVLYILLFIFVIRTPLTPHGLWVNFGNRHPPSWQESTWTNAETVGIYIDGKDKFYINRIPVAQAELHAKLEAELGRRMMQMVYLEADPGSSFGQAVYAMGVIQSLQAKLVWITPKMREDIQRKKERSGLAQN